MTAIDTQGGGNALDQRKPFMSELTVQRGIEPELILVKIKKWKWFTNVSWSLTTIYTQYATDQSCKNKVGS